MSRAYHVAKIDNLSFIPSFSRGGCECWRATKFIY